MIAQKISYRVLITAALAASLIVLLFAFHTSDSVRNIINTTPTDDSTDDSTKVFTDLPAAEHVDSTFDLPFEFNDSEPQFDPTPRLEIGDKVAVIIETRVLNTLLPLVLHFASVLGPTWPVLLYTSPELQEELHNAAVFKRWSHQIEVRSLPNDTSFATHGSVNNFLTNPWLWENLAPADHVLLFQADSIICANSNKSVDDFLGWDIIGAPITERLGKGYNGGLSIRNRNKVLQVLKEFDFQSDANRFAYDNRWDVKWEDQWMAWRMSQMIHHKLPSPEIAKTFAVETIYYETPLGYHQPTRWQQDHMEDIKKWCPEVSLLIGAKWTN